ncbi:MAG: hypothetical protein F6K42_33830, partial [Leptolyngbya sp. SIO1D8]|nr:hypothetical protein [Leptolyngbya sp. SIO1D8]
GKHLVTLTPKEYGILELFLRNPQQVFSAQVILDRVWHSAESPGDEVVRVHIKDLRKKLKATGAPKNFIETLQRMGYRLNPLYSAQTNASLTTPQIAELESVKEALQNQVTTAKPTQTVLQQRDQTSVLTQQLIEQEQHQLQVRNEELEQRLVELTTALAEANRQLQQKGEEPQLEELGQQVRAIAHGLNSVFTSILVTVRVLQLTQEGLDTATQERLTRLAENARHGASLVKRLRALI